MNGRRLGPIGARGNADAVDAGDESIGIRDGGLQNGQENRQNVQAGDDRPSVKRKRIHDILRSVPRIIQEDLCINEPH